MHFIEECDKKHLTSQPDPQATTGTQEAGSEAGPTRNEACKCVLHERVEFFIKPTKAEYKVVAEWGLDHDVNRNNTLFGKYRKEAQIA